MLRPEDVQEAATWFTGVSVRHVPGSKSSPRVATAKWAFWGALRTLGLSFREIADYAGCDPRAVLYGTRKAQECHITAILERANAQLDQED